MCIYVHAYICGCAFLCVGLCVHACTSFGTKHIFGGICLILIPPSYRPAFTLFIFFLTSTLVLVVVFFVSHIFYF